eukprot:Selendium_serpulae@DN7116_c0_g1_i1.p1
MIPQLLIMMLPSFSFTTVFSVLIAICVFETLIAFVAVPDSPYVKIQDALDKDKETLPLVSAGKKAPEAAPKPKGPNFIGQFLSLGNIIFFCYFAFSYWRMAFYNGHVISFLRIISDDDKAAVSSYTTLLSYMIPFGSLGSIFLGWVTDKFGFTAQILITNTCGLMLSVLTLVPILPVQMLTFLMFVIYKGNLIGSLIYFITSNFGFGNLGKILGFDTAGAAVAYMGFEALVTHLEKGMSSKMELHYYLIVVGLTLYLCPLYLHLKQQRKQSIEKREKSGEVIPEAEAEEAKPKLPRAHRASSIMLVDTSEAGDVTGRVLKDVAEADENETEISRK